MISAALCLALGKPEWAFANDEPAFSMGISTPNRGALPTASPATSHASIARPALTAVARRTVEYFFQTDRLKTGSLSQVLKEFPIDYQQEKPAGVFVTLSRDGKSRGCWGSLTPGYKDIVSATVYQTVSALTREYRFAPVRPDEWKHLKVQVTVVRAVEPIHSISSQNPVADGLLVRSGGKSGILLPREARDAYYQLVQCKLKAGIKAGEPCQLYRIRADVYQ
jgi:AMMECR1 domain-containing protein